MEVKIEDEKSVKNNYDAAMMRQLVLPTRESQTIMIEVVVKYYIWWLMIHSNKTFKWLKYC